MAMGKKAVLAKTERIPIFVEYHYDSFEIIKLANKQQPFRVCTVSKTFESRHAHVIEMMEFLQD